jgi:hypothetical protein
MVGFADLDLDVKRSAKSIGLRGEEGENAIQDLERGEFFMKGPALGRNALRVKVGPIKTDLRRTTSKGTPKVAPPPSAKLKTLLNAELTDLAAQSKEELRDKESMTARIRELERELRAAKAAQPPPPVKPDPEQRKKEDLALATFASGKTLETCLSLADVFRKELAKALDAEATSFIEALKIEERAHTRAAVEKGIHLRPGPAAAPRAPAASLSQTRRLAFQRSPAASPRASGDVSSPLNKTARSILNLLLANEGRPLTKAQIAGWTHYSIRSSTYRNGMSQLRARGLLTENSTGIELAAGRREEAIELLGDHYNPEVTVDIEGWLSKLNKTAREMFLVLQERQGEVISKEEISERTGYRLTSSTFRNGVSMLCARKLAERVDGGLRFNPELLGA